MITDFIIAIITFLFQIFVCFIVFAPFLIPIIVIYKAVYKSFVFLGNLIKGIK